MFRLVNETGRLSSRFCFQSRNETHLPSRIVSVIGLIFFHLPYASPIFLQTYTQRKEANVCATEPQADAAGVWRSARTFVRVELR